MSQNQLLMNPIIRNVKKHNCTWRDKFGDCSWPIKSNNRLLNTNECTTIRYVPIEYEYNLLALKALLYSPRNL